MAADIESERGPGKTLLEIFNNPQNLANDLYVWACSIKDRLPNITLDEANKQLSVHFFYALAFGLGRVKGVSSLEIINLLIKVYGAGGPLETEEMSVSTGTSNSPELIGALYFLAHSEHAVITPKTRQQAIKTTVDFAFHGKKKWRELATILKELDRLRPGHSLFSSVHRRLESLEAYVEDAHDAGMLESGGGIKRINAVGADLGRVRASVVRNIGQSRLALSTLPIIHRFVTTSTEALKASGRLSEDQVTETYADFLKCVLGSLNGRKRADDEELRPIFSDLVQYANQETASDLVLQLCLMNWLEDLEADRERVVSMVDPDDFKKGLESLIHVGDRHGLVTSLGLEQLFSNSEMNTLKGAKLESALGL